MENKPKFVIGAILKHKAANKHEAIRLLVIGVGVIKYQDSTEIMYVLSAQKNYSNMNDTFFRCTLNEYELELFDN